MRRCCLVLLAVFLVGCGAEPTPTKTPSDTPDPVATTVASIKITLTAEAAHMPSATPTPIDTPAPTATATPTVTPTPTPLPPPRLEGQVLDATSSEPLVGAQVSANERETTTDSDGRFLFTDLAPGPYTVLVTSADHDPVLSGIVDLRAGEQMVIDATLPAAGTGDYPRDPMASNQIDPAGAPTAQEAERLARVQGLQGEVVSIREVVLEGEYLVNYKKGDAIRSAMATLHHPAWELVDGAGQAWYIIRVCGNLAVVRAPKVEVPAQCVARPNPVVTVGDQAVNAYTCPAETCSVALELTAGWHGVALECAPGCGWLRVQCPGIDGDCWVRRDWLQTWGELAELPIQPVAVSGQIAFFSDRDSPGYGEIFLMNPDGSNQVRLTSNLHLPAVGGGTASWVISLRWSPALRRFFFNSGYGGRFYTVKADGSGGRLVAERIFGIDVAPDGQRIVAEVNPPTTSHQSEIVIMSTDATEHTVLTNDAVRASLGLAANSQLLGPTWSPDGNAIAFYSHNPHHICVLNVDKSGPRILASEMPNVTGGHMDWSPDGRYILFPEIPQVGILDVTSGDIRHLSADGMHATWSPDGSRILMSRPIFLKDAQIWVINADGTSPTQLTFEGQNCCPVWLP